MSVRPEKTGITMASTASLPPTRDGTRVPALPPKYAIAEVERRWLVDLTAVGPLEGLPYREVEDLYIAETQLRLRKMKNGQGEVVRKLCKKYGKSSDLSEAVTNLYLSDAEYALLARLNGKAVFKRRYEISGGALDLYVSPSAFAVFEVEFHSESEAARYMPPAFVREEVTNNESYSGAALAARVARPSD
jgi:CYTH domain-containing protein